MQPRVACFPEFTLAKAKLVDFPHDLYVLLSIAAVAEDKLRGYIYKYAYTLKEAAEKQYSNMVKSVYSDRADYEYTRLFNQYWMPWANVDKEVMINTRQSVILQRAEKAHNPFLMTLIAYKPTH